MDKNKEATRTLLALIALGSSPGYENMEDPVFNKYGSYTGGFRDEWKWKLYAKSDISIEDSLYIISKTQSKDVYDLAVKISEME